MPPPYNILEYFFRGEFLKGILYFWTFFFGNFFYTILLLFTAFMLWLKTRSIAYTGIVMLTILSFLSFLIAPETTLIWFMLLAFALASIFYRVARSGVTP